MRKKLFAVIMSAMMMITFMPTMAFAGVDAGSASWNDSYSHVAWTENSGADSFDCDANRYAMSGTKTPGTLLTDRASGTSDVFNGWMQAYPKETGVDAVDYLDFNFAKVTKIGSLTIPRNGKISVASAEALFGENFENEVAVTELKFSVPTYAKNANDPGDTTEHSVADESKAILYGDLSANGFKFKVSAPAYDFEKQYAEDQTFELIVLPTIENGATCVGSVPSFKLTIVKDTPAAKDAVYLLDGKKYVSGTTVYYDGAEHKLAQKAVSGVTSTYKMFNKKTGKYEAVSADAVTVKNVGTYYVKATAKDSKGTKDFDITVVIAKSCAPTVTFKGYSDSTTPITVPTFKVAGKFDAREYLYIVPGTLEASATAKIANKALKADEKAIAAFCNEWYDITIDENNYATIEAKELTDAEKAAVKKTYADLLGNYALTAENVIKAEGNANFKVIDDINFTKAPLTKTYKAKNGKLAKAKKFTVKAKAASGAKLVYKVKNGAGKITVNRTTGKVTVKKGLKKGTYKVKVCAITLNSFDWETPIQDSYTLKVKVK